MRERGGGGEEEKVLDVEDEESSCGYCCGVIIYEYGEGMICRVQK